MQLMGLVLGEGCFCVCLRRSQRRDLGDRRALLSGGGALLRWRGNALVGVIRRVLVGYERSRGFLQAEDSALKKRPRELLALQQSIARGLNAVSGWLKRLKIVRNAAYEVALDFSLSFYFIHVPFCGCRLKQVGLIINITRPKLSSQG